MKIERLKPAVGFLWVMSLGPFLSSAEAQQTSFRQIDHVVAVVGKTPITASRVEERVLVFQSARPGLNLDSASIRDLRRVMLDSLINEELLVQAALVDTMVSVSEEEVQAIADDTLRTRRQEFVTERDFQRSIRETGFATVDEYRLWLVREIRRRQLAQAYTGLKQQMGEIRPVPPTETELQAEFEKLAEEQRRLQPRPPTVTFRQVVLSPKPDTTAMLNAVLRADSVLRRARAGEDFAALAREFSEDPGSAENGGELGWVRRGMLAKEFERMAFRLRPGQISNLVYTSFGFHIIQVQRAEPAEVKVRHILVSPEVSDAQVELARLQADTVAILLGQNVPLDSVLRLYHDQDESSYVEHFPEPNLPEVYQNAVAGLGSGDVAGPVPIQTQGGEKYAVILFLDRLAEGELTLDEFRDRLRAGMGQTNGVLRFIRELRESSYVEILDPVYRSSP